MKREQFLMELARLASGFEVDMAKDRVEAWWSEFGEEARAECFQWAVTRCLLDPRFPKADEFRAALQQSTEFVSRRQREKWMQTHAMHKLVSDLANKLSGSDDMTH